ncbi:hypothetical protein AB1K70_19190 [Bremerella sp. JC770]|uniref:hypothetical protein n=1 Tax=Bremerella sp. JC770 TaxID=3232137 RepID=UPI0034593616
MTETQRKVRYLLGVEVDQQAQANADKLAAIVTDAEKRKTKVVEEETRKRGDTERERIERLNAEIEKQAGISHRANREMHDGLLQAGEGAVTLIRGFAELGVVQKENAEEMLKALIQIQAAVDLTKGSMELYRGMASLVDAYRTSVVAATTAETALAAARGRTAAAGNLGLATSVGSTAAGVSGLPAAGALGTAISGLSAAVFSLPGAVALAITGALAGGAMALNVGGIRDKTANAIPEGWVDPNSMFGGFAGRVGGVGDMGAGGLSLRGAQSAMFGGFSPDIFGTLAGDQTGATAAEEATRRREAQRAAEIANFQRNNATAQGRFDLSQQLTNLRFSRMSAAGVDPQAQLAQANSELQRARQGSATASAMQPGRMREAEIERAAQAEIAALTRVIDLRKESLNISRQESRERLAGVTQETAELMKQLDIAKKQQQTAEDRLKSAKERFGGLDEATQRRTIAAKQKAETQGASALSREERALLRGLGTGRAGDLASEGDTAAADRAGFDLYFGDQEAFDSSLAASTQSRLEAKIKVQRELKIQIEDDIDRLTDRIGDAVDAKLDEREKLIVDQLTRRFGREQTQRNRQPTPGTTSVGG